MTFTLRTTISMASLRQEFGLTPRALRFYEEKGLISPGRNGLARVYSAADRERIGQIVWARRLGISVQEICKMLLVRPGQTEADADMLRLTILRKHLHRLEKRRAELDEALGNLAQACGKLDGLRPTSAPWPDANPVYRRHELLKLQGASEAA